VNPRLDIVIVNWNTGDLLARCLESIEATDRSGFVLSRVVILDNASSDQSMNRLEKRDSRYSIIENLRNEGFAKGCNQGAADSQADYILFLNPDVVLESDALRVPIQFLEEHRLERLGMVGIQLVNQEGKIARTCCRFPSLRSVYCKMLGLSNIAPEWFHSYFMSEWDHQTSREVDHVVGAFYLIRRELFKELGGFDERFFVYLEDVDLSKRAAERGWKAMYLSEVRAFHRGGGSSSQIKARRLFYAHRSLMVYGMLHFSWFSSGWTIFGVYFVDIWTRLFYAMGRGSWSEFRETLRAYVWLVAEFPKLFGMFIHRGRFPLR
jgi:GT2 family glycosyltransferase